VEENEMNTHLNTAALSVLQDEWRPPGPVNEMDVTLALRALERKSEGAAIDFVSEALSEMSDALALRAIEDAANLEGSATVWAIRHYMKNYLQSVQDELPGESDPFDNENDDKSRADDVNSTLRSMFEEMGK
jgi:hypothetical protein